VNITTFLRYSRSEALRSNVTVFPIARLFIRIDFEGGGAFGPGKAHLLELI
jgi:hypothetical protein